MEHRNYEKYQKSRLWWFRHVMNKEERINVNKMWCREETCTVGTPNFVSSYRLQPVVNDSDLLSGRDFASLTHRSHRVS